MHDVHFGTVFSSYVLNSQSGTHVWDQLAIVDSNVFHIIGGGGGYGTYASARRFSFLGNVFDDTMAAEHVLRTPYVGKGVISNNSLTRPSGAKHALKMHAPCQGFITGGCDILAVEGNNYTEQVVISDNIFRGALDASNIVVLGPQNDMSDERLRNIVFERNWLQRSPTTQNSLIIHGVDVTVRNNLCDMTGASLWRTCFVTEQRGIEPAPNNVRFYNNTGYSPDASSEFFVVRLGATATNVTVKNNLASAPLATGHTVKP